MTERPAGGSSAARAARHSSPARDVKRLQAVLAQDRAAAESVRRSGKDSSSLLPHRDRQARVNSVT